MVTSGNGTVTLKGNTTGKLYSIDFYSSDVVAAPCTFSPSGNAVSTSLTFYKTQEDCTLMDISFASSNTVSVSWTATMDGGIVAGRVYRIANFLNTLTTRPNIGLRMPAGTNFGLLQG